MSSLQALPIVKVVARVQSSWDGRGIASKRQTSASPKQILKITSKMSKMQF